MTHAEVMERLTGVFRDVFDDDSIVITDQTTANDIEEWDSLEHINLIDAVEQEFHMQFQMKEVWYEECGRNGRHRCQSGNRKAEKTGTVPPINRKIT